MSASLILLIAFLQSISILDFFSSVFIPDFLLGYSAVRCFFGRKLANAASARTSRERAKVYLKKLESEVEKLSQEVSPTGPINHVL